MFKNLHLLKYFLSFGLVAGLICLPGCAEDEDEEDESPPEHACEHFQNGPFVEIVASADSLNPTPTDHEDWHHTCVVIAFENFSEEQWGYVEFYAEEENEYIFFFDKNIPFAVDDSTYVGYKVPPCDLSDWHYHIDLEVGDHVLSFLPGSESEVRVVVYEQ